MSGFFGELKRRNVFRVAIVYGIAGWLIMQIADVMFPALSLPEWSISFLAAMLILGFPMAIIFAWAFELTPDGIKLEKNVDPTTSTTRNTGRKLDFIIIGLLSAALVVAVGLHFVGDSRKTDATESGAAMSQSEATSDSETASRSIAVLPFVNMSADPDNEYFSDGISEELLNLLVKVDGLTVASRTSSFRFKDKDVDIPTVAKQLNVRHILEGSVRRSGVKVRITAQLIDAATDKHLWSDAYDRELNDIFTVQDEIANKIVAALKTALGSADQIGSVDAKHPTDNIEAYELYLQGLHIWRLRGIDNINKSIELFEKAVDVDPAFARAWSALATAYILVPVYSVLPRDEQEGWRLRSQTAARRAIELDPALSEPHTTLAAIYESQGGQFAAQAEEEFRKAIEIDPKSELAYQWYGEFLAVPGRLRASHDNLKKAYMLDPASPVINDSLAFITYLQGKYDESIEYARRANEMGLVKNSSTNGLATIYFLRGQHQDAVDLFADADDDHFEKKMALAAAGHSDRDAAIAEIITSNMSFAEFLPSALLLWFGDKDVVLDDMLDRAKKQRLWPGELWQPKIMEWADDPRFIEAVEITGLPQYWRENTWADRCQPDGDSFRCELDIEVQ